MTENVQFEEVQRRTPIQVGHSPSRLKSFVMRIGIAKNGQQADIVLLMIAVFCGGLAIYISGVTLGWFGHKTVYREDLPSAYLETLTPEELQKIPTRK